MRNSQAIAGFVVGRFAIDQEHVMMSAIAGDVMNGRVPGIEDAVAMKGDALPAGKGANDFNGGGRFCFAIGKTPAENLGKGLLLLSVLSAVDGRRRRFAHWRKAFLRRLAIKQIAKRRKHSSGFRTQRNGLSGEKQ